jgi:hypothetical protein
MTAPNAELAWRVLDQIDAHPETWNQRDWASEGSCGTAYCFAGWAALLAGHEIAWLSAEVALDGTLIADYVVDASAPEGKQWVGDAAREALGIADSLSLFAGHNTREDLHRLVAEIFGPRPRSCCASTEDVGHDFTCPVMLGEAGISLTDDIPASTGGAS